MARAAIAVGAVVALGAGALLGHVPESSAGSTAPLAAPLPTATSTAKPAPTPTGESLNPSSTLPPQETLGTAQNGVTINYHVKTKNPVFFITVDDGWNQQAAAADYVDGHHLPVTVFLTNAAVGGNWAFFKRMSAFDAVQNHSLSHKALTKVHTNINQEICSIQARYAQHFGAAPWILRPPYGAGFMPMRPSAPKIEKTVAACGIKHIALWNAEVSPQGKLTFAEKPFQPGDIVLFHFDGDLKSALEKTVAAYAAHGLKPASLSQYLAK